jgi:hypothetical protein
MGLAFDPSRDRAQYAVYEASASGTAVPNLAGAVEEQARHRPYKGAWMHYAVVHQQWVASKEHANETDSDLNISVNATSGVPVNVSSNSSSNISEAPEPNVWVYRDGELVASSFIPYSWSDDILECSVGAGVEASPLQGFAGDSLFFYYWNDALTKKQVSYTRVTNLPHHASENVSVFGAMGSECRDIDECELGLHTCLSSTCINTIGSFMCAPVRVKYEQVLEDQDECAQSNDTCPLNRTCANTLGSFVCLCGSGTTYNISFTGSNTLTLSDETRLGTDGLTVSLWVKPETLEGRLQPLVECSPPFIGAPYFMVAFNATDKTFVYILSNDKVSSVNATAASVKGNVPLSGSATVAGGPAFSNTSVLMESGNSSVVAASSNSMECNENSTNACRTLRNNSAPDVRRPSWSHYALVHSKQNRVSMYVDGVLVLATALPYTLRDSNAAQCTVGGSMRTDMGNFRGWMRGVYVWAQALDVVQVCLSVCP